MERRRPRNVPSRPLVLVVDGHADTRELYALSLEYLGFEATMVADDQDAYAYAWQTHPDIIVAELTVPGFDGWHFLRDMKGNARTREIPIVIVTADEGARERAIRAGCSAFLVKPCSPEDLAATLRQVLTERRVADYVPLVG
jgi:CheY-like chemotaxis protein